MKKIICIIIAMTFVLIPLNGCNGAGGDGSETSESTESNDKNLQSSSKDMMTDINVRDEAINIINDLLERMDKVTLHFMSTAEIRVDEGQKLPNDSDYALVTDEALKDCHSIDDLKAYVEKAYTNDYAEKYIYPTYLYKGDDGKPRFKEYEGNLYVNQATASTMPSSIAEVDYDTLYVADYNKNENVLQVKYDEYIPDYTEQGNGDEWSGTYCLTLVKHNDVWTLDKAGFLDISFVFEPDCYII